MSKINVHSILDKFATHPIFGIPIFFIIMYTMFAIAMNLGSTLQTVFDVLTQVIFMELPQQILNNFNIANWFKILLIDGVGRGLNITLTFIPVLVCIFSLLSWLEQTGYIVRAVFLVDRMMQVIGLPGRAFVSMIIGFGCNVPAIISAHSIENKADKILTVLLIPFMSCSARLGIYVVFTSAFFLDNAHNIIFFLYLIGILMAILTGLLWRKLISSQEAYTKLSNMQFPSYHWPSFKLILQHTSMKLRYFLVKTGVVIIPLCIVLGLANGIKINDNAESPLQAFGKQITPMFTPLGIHTDNWQASVGLLTGILAKEVMIGTLNVLYTQDITNTSYTDNNINIQKKINMLLNNEQEKLNTSALGVIYTKFTSKAAAFAYLLFILLYCPCISVIASTAQILNWRWAVFSIIWSTSLAYIVSAIFYQLATFYLHQLTSFLWISGLLVIFLGMIMVLRIFLSSNKFTAARIIPTQILLKTK